MESEVGIYTSRDELPNRISVSFSCSPAVWKPFKDWCAERNMVKSRIIEKMIAAFLEEKQKGGRDE